MRDRRSLPAAAALGALALASCTTNQVGVSPTPVPVIVAQTSKLQLAVGTANIGAPSGQQVTGLNVVATFRQSNGQNATGLNDPVLTGPAALNLGALGCSQISQLNIPGVLATAPPNTFSGATIPQLVASLTATQTTPVATGLGQFGPQVGVFGYGFGGYNVIPQTDLKAPSEPAEVGSCINITSLPFTPYQNPNVLNGGTALNAAELALPIGSGQPENVGGYASASGNPVSPALSFQSAAGQELPIATYGGPPGWPSPQGYGNFTYFSGFPEGFMDFGVTPVSGSYGLSATYPTNASYSQTATATASATLPSAGAILPAMPQPALTINPDGTGVLKLTVPPGVAETIVNVSGTDCDRIDRPAGPTNHFSIVTKQSGPQTLFLSANLAPPNAAGAATHTFCTVSDLEAYDASLTAGGQETQSSLSYIVYVQAVGFDYPAYESSYPFNTSEAPPITSNRGTADITTSYPTMTNYTISLPGSSS